MSDVIRTGFIMLSSNLIQ